MKTTLGIDQLLGLSLFRDELPGTIEWLLDLAEERILDTGEVLIQPDTANGTLYIVIEGSLRIELKERERPVITHIGAGECVGELSVIDGQPTAAYVVADRPTRLMLIDRESIWRLIFTSHAVARNLLLLLSARVRRDNAVLSESLALQRVYELNSRTDALTGLYNRHWMEQMLPRLIERARIGEEPLGLLMLDADHFKQYNDQYGHLAGDEALHAIATTVMSHIRPNDSAIRFGGEEVVIILPGLECAELLAAGERIRKAVSRAVIKDSGGAPLPPVTVSVGLATLGRDDDDLALIAAADKALYQAKEAGRNRVIAAWEESAHG